MTRPTPDATEIERTLNTLFEPGDVIELRALHNKDRKRTDAGYYDGDHAADLVAAAVKLNRLGAAVYVNLNPLNPHLLNRYTNRIKQFATATATDNDVIRRRWVLIDFDPRRPKDTAATDNQLDQAKATARAVFKYLRAAGWPDPVTAESGNGMHLLYRIDLPNDDDSRDVIKSILDTLAARFDTDGVSIDRSVFNASRIIKLHGTISTKGDHTPAAPWRLSRITSTPDPMGIVTLEQLRALIPAKNPNENQRTRTAGTGERLDVRGWLDRHGIDYHQDRHAGRDRYKLAKCPFNPDHINGEAAVFQDGAGVIGFKCQHNGCADKHWRDVRELFDGPRQNHAPGSKKATCGNSGGDEWQTPHPLPDGLHQVEPFAFELLPGTLRPWVQDICERVQCAADFVAVAVMVGLGSLIGRKIGIRPQARTDWTETANLWGLIVGRPGVLKSPATEQALAPLKRLVAQATEAHAAAMNDYQAAAQVAKLRGEAAQAAAKKKLASNPHADVSDLLAADNPEEPTLRRYIANDTSAAALGELHRLNPNGLLVHRDELVSLLRSLDRDDQAEARGFYLTGWNGDSPFTFDRIGRGFNLHIPAVCLSLLGGTQPAKLAGYVRHAVKGTSGDDGLIQRFGLLVWPDTGSEWRDVDRWPDGDAKRDAYRVFDYLDKLDPAAIGAHQDTDHNGEPDGIHYLRFDDAGHALFLEWRTELERRLRSNELHPALESHLAKYRKLIPGLALILHLADGGTGPVTEQATLQALAWGDYLESHAKRAYGSVSQPETAAAKAILQRIRKGDLTDGFSTRDVLRPNWSMLDDRDQVADALRLLVDYGWLREERDNETGGRPATTYHVNPAALS
jgi:hypothetical protein